MNEVSHLKLVINLNGHTINAVVDSGVGSSIMSLKAAKHTKVKSLLDTSKAGTCYGAGGESRIHGKIHLLMEKINDILLPCSFYIGEMKIFDSLGVDLLIGLDFLSQHKISLNMDKLTLDVGTMKQNVAFCNGGTELYGKSPRYNDLSLMSEVSKNDFIDKKKYLYLNLQSNVEKQIKTSDINENIKLSKIYFKSSD